MKVIKSDISKISFSLLLMILLISTSILLKNINYSGVKAQKTIDPNIVALWYLDEVDSNNITPDATGINNATLAGSPPPLLVEGKFGQALSFNGADFLFVANSPSLDFQKEFTIEAWINVKAFKNNTHNNILVKCTRNGPDWIHVSRIVGLAIKAGVEENGVKVPQGGLGGFVFTNESGFNEVVTTEPVITLNQWYKVAFIRSFSTGLHIYVDGVEKETMILYGNRNPSGAILNGTELYIGHDAEVMIDEPQISNIIKEPPEPSLLYPIIPLGNVLLLIGLFTVLGVIVFLWKKK